MKIKLICLISIYLFSSCEGLLEGNKKNILNMDSTHTSESSLRLSIEEIMKRADGLITEIPVVFLNDRSHLDSFIAVIAKLGGLTFITEGVGRIINSLPPEFIKDPEDSPEKKLSIPQEDIEERFLNLSAPKFREILANALPLFSKMNEVVLEKISKKIPKLDKIITALFNITTDENIEDITDKLIESLNSKIKEFIEKLNFALIDLECLKGSDSTQILKEKLKMSLRKEGLESKEERLRKLKEVLGGPIKSLLDQMSRKFERLSEEIKYVKERLNQLQGSLREDRNVLSLISQVELFSIFTQSEEMEQIKSNYQKYIKLKILYKVLKEVLNSNTFLSLRKSKSTGSIGQEFSTRVRKLSYDGKKIVSDGVRRVRKISTELLRK